MRARCVRSLFVSSDEASSAPNYTTAPNASYSIQPWYSGPALRLTPLRGGREDCDGAIARADVLHARAPRSHRGCRGLSGGGAERPARESLGRRGTPTSHKRTRVPSTISLGTRTMPRELVGAPSGTSLTAKDLFPRSPSLPLLQPSFSHFAAEYGCRTAGDALAVGQPSFNGVLWAAAEAVRRLPQIEKPGEKGGDGRYVERTLFDAFLPLNATLSTVRLSPLVHSCALALCSECLAARLLRTGYRVAQRLSHRARAHQQDPRLGDLSSWTRAGWGARLRPRARARGAAVGVGPGGARHIGEFRSGRGQPDPRALLRAPLQGRDGLGRSLLRAAQARAQSSVRAPTRVPNEPAHNGRAE